MEKPLRLYPDSLFSLFLLFLQEIYSGQLFFAAGILGFGR
jgi:hypothetical protein